MTGRVVAAATAALLVCLALVVGCGGYETLLVPTKMRLSPGLATVAPGEVTDFHMRLFSLVGIEVPMVDQTARWNLYAEDLPADVEAPEGVRDSELPGVIDLSGRFEGSPVVQPGHYRTGRIRAEFRGTFGALTSTAFVIVDGNIDPGAAYVTVYPKDLRLPVGAQVPFVTLAIDPESKRVAPTVDEVWKVLEGAGSVSRTSGLYTPPGALPAEDQREVQVAVFLDSGRTDTASLTLDAGPTGELAELHLVPEGALKVGLGRSQTFLLYGTDRDGRYIPMPGADWLVEGGIGTITPSTDGTAVFRATAAGTGEIVVAYSDKALRRQIVSVIPGA